MRKELEQLCFQYNLEDYIENCAEECTKYLKKEAMN